MSLMRVLHASSYAVLRLSVMLRDLNLRHLRLLWHGLQQGGWKTVQKEVFPSDAVRTPGMTGDAAAPVRGALRKNVLVIDRSLPRFDRDAGSRATWQYIQLLCDMGYGVTVWGHDCLRREPYAGMLEAMGVQVLSGWVLACGNWRRWIRKHADQLHYVVLLRPNVAQAYMAYLKTKTSARLLYFGVDLRWLRNRRRYEVEGEALFQTESEYWKNVENQLIGLADASYFYSRVEVDIAMEQMPQATVRMLPLFLYAEQPGRLPVYDERHGLLFVGGFAHQPNVDGILWFVDQVFPLIRARLGDVRLRIVGESAPPALQGRPGLELLGAVSDAELEELYRSTRVVIAPLRYGAGIKGKVVEALFHQVPLVTTGIGAEGMPTPEQVMDVCELPADYADSVSRLYLDADAWAQRVAHISTYLAQHFAQDSAKRVLREIMC